MLVSVVIPAYNEEKYLPKTLESLIKLEGGYDIEVVVIDGSSTDNTVEVAKKFGAKVFTIPHDGIGLARQEGIRKALGEIIAFTDADTTVPPNWLSTHLGVLKRPGVVATFGPYEVDQSGGFPLYSFLINIRYKFIKLLPSRLKLLYIPGQNLVFWKDKAKNIGGFDVSLKVMEDVDFGLRLSRLGSIVYVPVKVFSSGRRGKEGFGFFSRGITTWFSYLFFKRRAKLAVFPDFR